MKIKSVLFLVVILVACQEKVQNVEDKEARAATASEMPVERKPVVSYTIIPAETKVHWEGSKPGTSHRGTVSVKKGQANLEGNLLVGGEVEIDMSTIEVLDLKGNQKANLEAHLKGTNSEKRNDFFNIMDYPYARFSITRTTPIANDPKFNTLVYGNLKVKGLIQEIGFKAFTEFENGQLVFESDKFSINRTDWGIRFMSKTFFPKIKDKFIDDEVVIRISMKASSSF